MAGIVLLAIQSAMLLLRIGAPFTEPAAYGRSCVNATIARNFLEHGMRVLYPQLDYGAPPGYAALEFPLIPYFAAIVYHAAGVHEWVGRGIPALFGLGTTIAVWLIARELTGSPPARVAAVGTVVLSPTFTFFSRVFQSDSAMVFFVVVAFLLVLRAQRNGSSAAFVFACASCAIGMLLKPSSLVLLPALVSVLLLSSEVRLWPTRQAIRRAALLVVATVLPVAVYYLFARTVNTYPETLGLDAVVRRATFGRMLQLSYDVQIAKDIVQAVTPAGIVALACGLLLALRRRDTWFMVLWAVGAVGLDLIFNEALSHHEYYQLIWVPLAAMCAAVTVDAVEQRPVTSRARYAIVAVTLILVGGSAVLSWRFLALRFAFPPASAERLVAAALVEQHTPADALVGVEDIDLLYYSHRRGWPYGNDTGQPIATSQLLAVQGRGVEYVMVADPARTLSDEARTFLSAHGTLIATGDRAMLWRLR